MKRRSVFKAMIGSAAVTAVGSGRAIAIPASVGRMDGVSIPTHNGRVLTLEQLERSAGNLVGNETPLPEEISQARSILNDAPTGPTPFDVALYFHYLRMGALDSRDYRYAMEWPQRANPVIVVYFGATDYGLPDGDITAWCAAFVNWCYARANNGQSATNSAASRSFRSFSDETNCPKVGDLVVFKKIKNSGFGHVGFYVGHRNDSEGRLDSIFVLGGNQSPEDARNNGEVNIREFSANGQILRFHSFRKFSDVACS